MLWIGDLTLPQDGFRKRTTTALYSIVSVFDWVKFEVPRHQSTADLQVVVRKHGRPSLCTDAAVFDADNPVCHLGDLQIVGDHYQRLMVGFHRQF